MSIKTPAGSTRPAAQKHQEGQTIAPRTCLLLFPSVHEAEFSAVTRVIPAPQILPKDATARFARGFPQRVSAAQPLRPSEISHNAMSGPFVPDPFNSSPAPPRCQLRRLGPQARGQARRVTTVWTATLPQINADERGFTSTFRARYLPGSPCDGFAIPARLLILWFLIATAWFPRYPDRLRLSASANRK